MKLLLINPNVTQAVTDSMLAEAKLSARAGTQIDAVTARFGAQYVATRIEAQIAGHAVLEQIAEHRESYDGFIVSAFGDPGLLAAREMAGAPVVGLAESALHLASMLCTRYSIICLNDRLAHWYVECAETYGLAKQLASVRPINTPVSDLGRARQESAQAVLSQCRCAIDEDGAELIIVGGGPLAGLARDLAGELPAPIIDGMRCAVVTLEALVSLGAKPAAVGTLARPPAKPTQNLHPSLTEFLEGKK